MYRPRTSGVVATSFIALVTVMSATASAQETANQDTDIEEIATWGTRVQASSMHLGEQEIAIKQADHLSDLLRPLPGVDIGGTHSVNSRINFRGLDDRNLSIYVDGALQTNYLYHHMGNLLINPDILKSADVQLGANTVTHGGIGGSLRFETMDAADLLSGSDKDFGGRFSGTLHSNKMKGASGTVYGRIADKADALVYFNHVDRGNFTDGSDRKTIGSDGTTQDLLAKVGIDVAENQRFEVSYNRLTDEGDYTQRPDMGVLTNEAITGDILLPTEYERETLTARYELDMGDTFGLEATYYMNDMRLWRDESNPGIPRAHGSAREAQADNKGALVLATSRFDGNSLSQTLKYGFEYFDQNQTYQSVAGDDSTSALQDSRSVAVFLEDEVAIGERFILRPGLRYTDYKVNYDETGADGSWDKLTFGLAAEAELSEGFRLLGSFTSLFRGPELAEVFGGPGSRKLVNPALDAETGHNVEVGFRYSGDVGEATVNLGANLFWTKLKNFIAETAVPGTTTREVWDINIGDAQIEGIEASANVMMGGWDALVTFSSSDLDLVDLTSAASTESLREVGDTLGAELSYTFTDTDIVVGWNMQHVFEKTDVSGGVKDAYTIHNLSARWENAAGVDGMSLIVGVDNLLDKTYTSHASRSGDVFHPVFGALHLNDVEPGRNIKVTLSQRF